MSTQSEQASRALSDQTRTMREMTSAAQTTAKQVKLITKANVEHSTVASALLGSMSEIRQITTRNAEGVKRTRGGTDDLLRRTQTLVALVDRPAKDRVGNGRSLRSTK